MSQRIWMRPKLLCMSSGGPFHQVCLRQVLAGTGFAILGFNLYGMASSLMVTAAGFWCGTPRELQVFGFLMTSYQQCRLY